MTLDQLKAQLDRMSPAQVRFVARVVDSLAHPPQARIRQSGTWLTRESAWIEYFGLVLSAHHALTAEPLGLTAFETAFRNACASVNWTLDPPGSPTQRFVDLTVQAHHGPARRLSLKSTAARTLSETRAHISKLTEAAWIQDARTPTARRQQIQTLFREYRQAVDAILMLRAFRDRDAYSHRYQLLEIPSSLFASVQSAPLDTFRSDAPVIDCQVGAQTVARVALDRSDAKITVRSILLSACVVHAEWTRT